MKTVIFSIQLLKPILGSKIDISYKCVNNVWPIWIDRGQLENTLINLVVNARDAIKEHGNLNIEVSNVAFEKDIASERFSISSGEFVQISITDNGEGIPDELLDKVMEPFFTTKEVGKGTGLGLSMVYGFVKQSQGYISINSEVGKGTTINLYFPKMKTKNLHPLTISDDLSTII